MFIVRQFFSILYPHLFQLAATDSNRPTNCMRFSGTRSQTFHSMTSSAITKSGSSSRLSHRVVNNTVASDDAVDISVQTDQEQLPQVIQIEPQGNHIVVKLPILFWTLLFLSPTLPANLLFISFKHKHPHVFLSLAFASVFHQINGNRRLLQLPMKIQSIIK